MADIAKFLEMFSQQMETLVRSIAANSTTIPNFIPFEPTKELWNDYMSRFQTFIEANSIPPAKITQVFLTNQSASIYKLLQTAASQRPVPCEVNKLDFSEIQAVMIQNFNPKRFIVRERFRFWTELKRQPGETIQELAAKIRTAASTCDFSSIEDTLDEALRTRFMCSVDNEAVLKSLFKIPEDELTFNRAVEIATEVEESAKVAKATVHGTPDEPVMKVLKAAGTKPVQSLRIKPEKGYFKPRLQVQQFSKFPFPKGTCPRCGKKGHHANDCKHIKTECNFCGIIGHLEKACLKKKFKRERKVNSIHTIPSHTPLIQMLQIAKSEFAFELDSGARDNFCSIEVEKVGKTQSKTFQYKVYFCNRRRHPEHRSL